MTIKLYKIDDEIAKVNKTLGTAKSVDGEPIPPFDMLNPVFQVSLSSTPEYNYVYIAEFGRYYYAEATYIGGTVWEFSCSVDPLMSWKTGIKALSAWVDRSASDVDEDIVDPLTQSKIERTTREISTTLNTIAFDGTNYNVIQNSTGSNFPLNGIVICGFNASYYKDVGDPTVKFSKFPLTYVAMKASDYINMLAVIRQASNDMLGRFIGYDKISDLLVSAKWCGFVPTNYEGGKTLDSIYVYGALGPSGADDKRFQITGHVLTSGEFQKIDLDYKFTAKSPKYLNFSNQDVILQFPPLGNIKLDNSLADYTVSGGGGSASMNYSIRLRINQIDGGCSVYQLTGDTGAEKEVLIGQTTLSFDLATIKSEEKDPINAIFNAIASPWISGGNPVSWWNAQSAEIKEMQKIGYQVNGSTQFGMIKPPVLVVIDDDVVVRDNSLYGSPLQKKKTLSTLSGFTKVSEVHVEGMAGATRAEMDNIEAWLKNGVIL